MQSMLLAALLAPLVPVQSGTPAWYWIGGNDNTQTYVDLNSLRPLGGKTIAVTRSVYAKPIDDTVFSSAIRSEYDCAGNYFRTLEYSFYGSGGALMSTEPSATINEHKVPAKNSINEAALDFICYRKGGTAIADPMADAQARF